MKDTVVELLKILAGWIKERARNSLQLAMKRHSYWLGKPGGVTRLLIALGLFLLFLWVLFPTDWKLGFSFLLAGSTAIYSGIIYKGEDVIGLVLAGVLLATVIPTLFPAIRDSYAKGDYIGIRLCLNYLKSLFCYDHNPTFSILRLKTKEHWV